MDFNVDSDFEKEIIKKIWEMAQTPQLYQITFEKPRENMTLYHEFSTELTDEIKEKSLQFSPEGTDEKFFIF